MADKDEPIMYRYLRDKVIEEGEITKMKDEKVSFFESRSNQHIHTYNSKISLYSVQDKLHHNTIFLFV